MCFPSFLMSSFFYLFHEMFDKPHKTTIQRNTSAFINRRKPLKEIITPLTLKAPITTAQTTF